MSGNSLDKTNTVSRFVRPAIIAGTIIVLAATTSWFLLRHHSPARGTVPSAGETRGMGKGPAPKGSAEEGHYEYISIKINTAGMAKAIDDKDGSWIPIERWWNGGFVTESAAINRGAGKLKINFDFVPKFWAESQASGHGTGPMPLLVRMFDKNGQYLTHFITSEVFYAKGVSEDWLDWWSNRFERIEKHTGQPTTEMILLGDKPFSSAWPVNARDAAFVGQIELGWYIDSGRCSKRLIRLVEGGPPVLR